MKLSTTNHKSRPDNEMADAEIIALEQIPDEVVQLVRTKNGTVSIARRGVFKLAQRGLSITEIAGIFGVERHTISDNFKREINCGKVALSSTLKANLIRQALATDKPNPTLLLFALKNYTELTEEGIRGETDTPTKAEWNVEIKVKNTRKELSDSERAELDES